MHDSNASAPTLAAGIRASPAANIEAEIPVFSCLESVGFAFVLAHGRRTQLDFNFPGRGVNNNSEHQCVTTCPRVMAANAESGSGVVCTTMERFL
jgi:hypothetical protein